MVGIRLARTGLTCRPNGHIYRPVNNIGARSNLEQEPPPDADDEGGTGNGAGEERQSFSAAEPPPHGTPPLRFRRIHSVLAPVEPCWKVGPGHMSIVAGSLLVVSRSHVIRAVRVLLLGSSDDTGQWFQGGKKKHEIAQDRLEAELGEPVEFIVKGIWPTPDLPGIVAGWVEKYEPDVVYLNTGSYWFLYRSVPLRMKRLLGRVGGESVGDAGFRFADSKRWAHNAVFRSIRRVLQETIGGDTHFTTQEVIDRMTECTRIAVRREGAVVVVKGPHGKARYASNPRRFRRDEAERLKLHVALEELCDQLHITYDGVGAEAVRHLPAYGRGTTAGDGLHANAVRHDYEAEGLYAGIRRGLEAAGRVPAV